MSNIIWATGKGIYCRWPKNRLRIQEGAWLSRGSTRSPVATTTNPANIPTTPDGSEGLWRISERICIALLGFSTSLLHNNVRRWRWWSRWRSQRPASGRRLLASDCAEFPDWRGGDRSWSWSWRGLVILSLPSAVITVVDCLTNLRRRSLVLGFQSFFDFVYNRRWLLTWPRGGWCLQRLDEG